MKLVMNNFLAAIVAMFSLIAVAASSSSAVTSQNQMGDTVNTSNNEEQLNHRHRRMDKKEKKKKKKKDKKNSTSAKSNKNNSTSAKSAKYTNSTKSGKYTNSTSKSDKYNSTMNAKSTKAKDSNATATNYTNTGAKSVKMNVMRSSSSMSMSMVVVYDDESPTLAPTLLPTMMPTTTIKLAVEDDSVDEEEGVVDDAVVVDDDDATDVAAPVLPVPICPTPYNITKTTYIGGSKVEMTSHIFECHSLYVQYCNIGTWDDSLQLENENAEELWSDAWVHVGPCSIDEVVEEEVVVLSEAEDEDEDEVVVPEVVVTEVPTTMPTFSPTLVPTVVDIEAKAESALVDKIPICPADYDTTKTDYVGGDFVTVDSSIFECHTLYVQYCNIAEWDDSLLVGNVNAEEMWDNSWVFVGPCEQEGKVIDKKTKKLFFPSVCCVISRHTEKAAF